MNIKEGMTGQIVKKSWVAPNNGTNTLANVLKHIQTEFFVILMMLAIGLFLYLGIKLMIARGNEEEYKKALLWFVYAIAGLAIIPLSYALVYFVSRISF